MRSYLLLTLLILLANCQGCLLFLPTRPGLIYRGDVQNVHGLDETGRGGNLYRTGDAAYVFNPYITLLQSDRDSVILRITDYTQTNSTNAGFSIVLQCRFSGKAKQVCSTVNGSLRAWLVRDYEYSGSELFRAESLSSTTTKSSDSAYTSLFVDDAKNNDAQMKGLYRLVGSIEIQRNEDTTPLEIDFLSLKLATSVPVRTDDAWLAAQEKIGRAEDKTVWLDLRSKEARGRQQAPAKIGGTFDIEHFLDYSNMP